MKKRCQFQGGAGLEDKYRPASPCLGEFLVLRSCNEPRQKYCKVCAPFAKKWLSAQNANAAYKREPEKRAKITRENRWKRRKTAGRPCPRLGIMVRCKYRDKRGRRGEGCLGKFERKSSFQKFCAACQKHADADRARAYRETHPEEEAERSRKHWEEVNRRAATGRVFDELKSRPLAWRLIMPLTMLDPSLTKAQLRKLAGKEAELTSRQMTRLAAKLREWLPSWPGFGIKTAAPQKARN